MKDIFPKINKDVYLFRDEQVDRDKNILRLFEKYSNEDFNELDTIKEKIKSGQIKNVILTGMGSSLYALKEQERKILENNLKVILLEASKLDKYFENLNDESTLLVVVSQSGTSPEVVSLLSKFNENTNAIAITNNSTSPMSAVSPMYEIYSDSEFYIAHNSYINTLLLLDWILSYLFDKSVEYTQKDVVRSLANQDVYIKNNWDNEYDVFKNVDSVDIITISENVGTGLNTSLLLREGLGLMANTFTINEYYHGEHLVNNKNKLTVFLDVDPQEFDRKYMNQIETVNNNKYLFIDYNQILNGEDFILYPQIDSILQMAFFNRVVDKVMKEFE